MCPFLPAHVFILHIYNSTTAAKYFSTPKSQVPFQFSTGQVRNPPGNSPFSTGCFLSGAIQTCEKLQDSTASLPHWPFMATLTSFFLLLIPYSISYIPGNLLKQDKFISIKLQACWKRAMCTYLWVAEWSSDSHMYHVMKTRLKEQNIYKKAN